MKRSKVPLRTYRKSNRKKYEKFVLGADVGGTNTNIAVAGVWKGTTEVLFSMHFKSQELKGIEEAISVVLAYSQKQKISVSSGCIAMAGAVAPDGKSGDLTNVKWGIRTAQVYRKTKLKTFIVNDFQAIGFGVNMLKKTDLTEIRKGKQDPEGVRAIIGAGTGLGKTTLIYHKEAKLYHTNPSEGGHVDFAAESEEELQLGTFVQKQRKLKHWPEFEELVSGRGIEHLYRYIRSLKKFPDTKYTKEIDRSDSKIPKIASYRRQDKTCAETFRLFSIFYGRVVKNFALDTYARGGVYIAGGIAAKHIDLFKSKPFLDAFLKSNSQSKLLKDMPLYVITNYDVSLYGACFAAMQRGG